MFLAQEHPHLGWLRAWIIQFWISMIVSFYHSGIYTSLATAILSIASFIALYRLKLSHVTLSSQREYRPDGSVNNCQPDNDLSKLAQ